MHGTYHIVTCAARRRVHVVDAVTGKTVCGDGLDDECKDLDLNRFLLE